MLHTPFDKTIFLDGDTFVCDDIDVVMALGDTIVTCPIALQLLASVAVTVNTLAPRPVAVATLCPLDQT